MHKHFLAALFNLQQSIIIIQQNNIITSGTKLLTTGSGQSLAPDAVVILTPRHSDDSLAVSDLSLILTRMMPSTVTWSGATAYSLRAVSGLKLTSSSLSPGLTPGLLLTSSRSLSRLTISSPRL